MLYLVLHPHSRARARWPPCLSAAETAVMVLPPGRVHRLVEAEARGAEELDRLAVAPVPAARSFRARVRARVRERGAARRRGRRAACPTSAGVLSQVVAAVVFVLVTFALVGALPRTLAVANPERVGLDAALPARARGRGALPGRPRARRAVGVDRPRRERRARGLGVGDRRGVPLRRRPTRRPSAKRPRRRSSRRSPTSPRRSRARSWCRAPT